MAGSHQQPPWEGAIYDAKSRGWYDSSFASYSAAPRASKMSRRQYDKALGSLARTGQTSYERKAKQRRATRERHTLIEPDRAYTSKGFHRLPFYLADGGTPADIVAWLADVLPKGQQFTIDALGVLKQYVADKQAEAQADGEALLEAERQDLGTDPIPGEYEWRNVLAMHYSDDCTTAAPLVTEDLVTGIAVAFESVPYHYVVNYRRRQTSAPQPKRGRRK